MSSRGVRGGVEDPSSSQSASQASPIMTPPPSPPLSTSAVPPLSTIPPPVPIPTPTPTPPPPPPPSSASVPPPPATSLTRPDPGPPEPTVLPPAPTSKPSPDPSNPVGSTDSLLFTHRGAINASPSTHSNSATPPPTDVTDTIPPAAQTDPPVAAPPDTVVPALSTTLSLLNRPLRLDNPTSPRSKGPSPTEGRGSTPPFVLWSGTTPRSTRVSRPSDTNSTVVKSDKPSNLGAVLGVFLGVLGFLAIVGFLVAYIRRRRKKRRDSSEPLITSERRSPSLPLSFYVEPTPVDFPTGGARNRARKSYVPVPPVPPVPPIPPMLRVTPVPLVPPATAQPMVEPSQLAYTAYTEPDVQQGAHLMPAVQGKVYEPPATGAQDPFESVEDHAFNPIEEVSNLLRPSRVSHPSIDGISHDSNLRYSASLFVAQ